jgi:hypothetical protein
MFDEVRTERPLRNSNSPVFIANSVDSTVSLLMNARMANDLAQFILSTEIDNTKEGHLFAAAKKLEFFAMRGSRPLRSRFTQENRNSDTLNQFDDERQDDDGYNDNR